MLLLFLFVGSNTFPARSFPPDGTTFAQVTLGDKTSNVIPPYSYWNMQFYHSEAAYVRFELGLPRSASLGLYGRRNALPTHTHYDMLHVISGYKSRTTRASNVIATVDSLKLSFVNDEKLFVCADFGPEGGFALHGTRPLVRFALQRRRRPTGGDLSHFASSRHDPELPSRMQRQRRMHPGSMPMQIRIRRRRLQRQ